MSIGSISFWQQDQNFWSRSANATQAAAQSAALINVMANAVTAESQGLASIANQTALSRVNSALTAAVQSALQGSSTSSSSTGAAAASNSSTSASASSAGSPNSTGPTLSFDGPATGTGTVPLTTGTSLFSLGILAKGVLTVSDGTFTTTYTSTGTDTVGDLLNAINANVAGHANVAAWLSSSGKLVIAGKDTAHTITVGGSIGSAIGFGGGNNNFLPTSASPSTIAASSASATSSASGPSSSSSSSSSSSNSSTRSSTSASSGIATNSSLALMTGGTAALLLASNGASGNIVNLLA